MITMNDRMRGEEFLTAMAAQDPGFLTQYREWLDHPMTRHLMVQLENAREGATSPGPAPDGIGMAVSTFAAGAAAHVWDLAANLLFDFPRYASRMVPGQEKDVDARPPTL